MQQELIINAGAAQTKRTHEPDVLERVQKLLPSIRERGESADHKRRLPDETIEELRQVNAFRLLQPRRYGGLELGFDTLVDLAITLGEACSSTGWMAIVLNTGWMVACFPEAAQDAVWGDRPDALVATSFTPTRKVTPVDGGYRISGEWQFTSGIHHAEWVVLGGLMMADGPPDFRFFIVPRTDFEVVDDWNTIGLRGTGSATTVVRDAFVPECHTMKLSDLREGTTPGAKVHQNPLYRAPLGLVFPISIASPVIGAAKRGVREWRDYMKQRRQHGIFPVHEYVPNQLRLSESACEVEAAELLLRRDAREATDCLMREEPMPPERRARSYRDAGYAVKLCQQAIERVFQATGGHSVYANHVVQRIWRDVHTAGAHVSLRWDDAAERWGRAELGLRQNNAFFF